MIEIIEGLGVGSGKSYFTVKRLLDHWRKGGTAYIMDTMVIRWDECKKFVERRYGLLLEDSQLNMVTEEQVTRLFEHTPPGTEDCPLLIVVDECQGSLNARDWADKSKRDLFDWCTQSRHDCNDLWFISQSALNIDKQLRRLASYVWRIRNTKQWGSNIITLMCKAVHYASFGLHSGGFFIVSQLDQDNRTLIGRKQWIDQDAEIFACYESRSMRGKRKRAGNAVSRLKLARKPSKSPYLRWAIACVLIALSVAGCNVVRHLTGRDKQTKQETHEIPKTDTAPAYDLAMESFRAQITPNQLKTDKFLYVVGSMCPHGVVDGIYNGQVRVREPNGRVLYIVTDYNMLSGPTLPKTQGQPKTTDTKREIVVVPDRGLFPPMTSPFTHETEPDKGVTASHSVATQTPELPSSTPHMTPIRLQRIK